jgi:hypothetical protein
MRKVRLARSSLLPLVGDLRESVGAFEQGQVGPRLILRDLLDQGRKLGHSA